MPTTDSCLACTLHRVRTTHYSGTLSWRPWLQPSIQHMIPTSLNRVRIVERSRGLWTFSNSSDASSILQDEDTALWTDVLVHTADLIEITNDTSSAHATAKLKQRISRISRYRPEPSGFFGLHNNASHKASDFERMPCKHNRDRDSAAYNKGDIHTPSVVV